MGAGLTFSKPVGKGYLDGQFYFVNGAQLDFALETVASVRQGRNLVEVEPEVSFGSGAFDGSQDADAVTWRLAAGPRIGHEIAVSGYHGRYTPDYLKEQAWVNTLAVDGKTTLGRFEVEGEFIYTKFNRHQEVLNDFALQMVDSAAATSSAETATLETEIEAGFKGPFTKSRKGYWVDFKYRLTPEWLRKGTLGRDFEDPQLIPIFRWERIWFDDFLKGFDFAGGQVTGIEQEDEGRLEGKTIGFAVICEEIGKHRPITFIVATDTTGQVLDVALMMYREPIGAEVRYKGFVRQFDGKDLSDPIYPRRDVKNISGATLSVRAMSRGVRKALAVLQIAYLESPTSEAASETGE